MSQITQDQITRACTSGTLEYLITTRVKSEIERVVSLAIDDFLKDGALRDAVRNAVHVALRTVAVSIVGGK